MDGHRLDYGSVHVEWGDPRLGDDCGSVKVRITCICGTQFCGQGATFTQANGAAHDQFGRHLAFLAGDAGHDGAPCEEC